MESTLRLLAPKAAQLPDARATLDAEWATEAAAAATLQSRGVVDAARAREARGAVSAVIIGDNPGLQ